MKAWLTRLNPFLAPLGVFALVLIVRLPGLARFITVDEPAWLMFAANFYFALEQGDLAQTVYDYHPAVTTLWILTAAFVLYFPGMRFVMKKYSLKYWVIEELFAKYDKQPLQLLVTGRVISILVGAGLLSASYFLLRLLSSGLVAGLVVLTILFDPYVWGHARLLNHEAFMAGALFLSLLALLVFLYRRRQRRFLLLSGAAWGLALLTKSPAVVFLLLAWLAFLVWYGDTWGETKDRGRRALGLARDLALWTGTAFLVFFALWPGMWADPGEMLYQVFGNAFSYAFQGARLSVTEELRPEQFALDTSGLRLYLGSLFLKTTPVTWLGVLLALAGCVLRGEKGLDALLKRLTLYLALLAAGFVGMFGLAQGRNHLHYILTSYLALDALAGIGLAWGIQRLADAWPVLRQKAALTGMVVLLVVLHGAGGLAHYPYYYTYTNPLAVRLLPEFQSPEGYGEGLELAAAYLGSKSGASQSQAMSWFAIGPFSYYYPGQTAMLLPSETMDAEYAEKLRYSDYLVIYPILQKRLDMPVKLLRALQAYTPEHKIWINGREYIQIYAVKDFPDHFFQEIID